MFQVCDNLSCWKHFYTARCPGRLVVSQFGALLTAIYREEQARASSPTPSQRQAQIFQTQLSPQELAFQESLIQEREAEIQEIETGIHELHEIFRDLGTLVQEQGGMLGACSYS